MLASRGKAFFEQMPEERPRAPFQTRSAVAIFGMTLGFFLVINFALLAYLRVHSPNLGFWLINKKWSLLLDLDHPVDVLILGDSTANQGLVPEVIEEGLDTSALNLATVANLTFTNDVWMLQEYLARHSPPKVVLIMHSYLMWQGELNARAVSMIPFLRISNLSQTLSPMPIGFGELIKQVTIYLVPAYSQSQTIRSLVHTASHVSPGFSLSASPPHVSALGTYRVFTSDWRKVQEDINQHLAFLRTREPYISDDSLAGLRALKELAEKHDFEVVIFNAPIASQVAESPDFVKYFSPISSELSDFWAGSQNVHYVSDVLAVDVSEMESADHMLAGAADEFTAWVSESFLREILGKTN